MTSADNPKDSNTVKMLRELIEEFLARPARFTEWEAKFIAAMWCRSTTLTDGTPVYELRRLLQVTAIYTRIFL